MKVFLLHREEDFQVKQALRDDVFDAMLDGRITGIANARREAERKVRNGEPAPPPTPDDGLAQDLELTTLWDAMADGDQFLFETARRAVLSSLADPDAIRYRQDVLADCFEHADVVRDVYGLAVEALEAEREVGALWDTASPERILGRSVRILHLHVEILKRLRALADEQAAAFRSHGFTRFFAMIREELSDEYLRTVDERLEELRFKPGLAETAELGKGLTGRGYTVHRPRHQRWTERLSITSRPHGYSFTIPARDESGFKALEEIRERGVNRIANAVARSADHVKSFFSMLRIELAFYLGCLNLRRRLDDKGEPTCFPDPLPADPPALRAEGLYDVCLSLHLSERTVANDVDADGTSLIVITGANQGGKSTLLRGLGVAQLMMQAGMFVAGRSFRSNVCTGVFTHYKREEDVALEGGKLDEELRRMSNIADAIQPHALLLCNESFASTNEREGSAIAREVVGAMLERHIKVAFVTHMYDLAHGWHESGDPALFLRAEREPDGRRTFRLVPGEPLPTSFGKDAYRRIFADQHTPAATRGAAR